MLTPVEKLNPLAPLAGSAKDPVERDAALGAESPFGAIFRSAVENVKETDAEYKESKYLLATGQLDNPAMSMIAGTQAKAAVDLLIQLRNKALDAYSELTRINL